MRSITCQDYSINLGDIAELLQLYLNSNNYDKYLCIVDENTRQHCLPLIQNVVDQHQIHLVEIPSGEHHKHLDTCRDVWEKMLSIGMTRHSLVINLGGGVIGDLGGFCASCYMRGIDFIQVPTTLLAQVDASIGGKVAVDFQLVKNIIGCFKNPKAVLIDIRFLQTLEPNELASGWTEWLKHALIDDAGLWNYCQDISTTGLAVQDIKIENLAEAIDVKRRIVEQDPLEQNLRKHLNYGHTVGHAIESYSHELQVPLLHGQAVLIGMICENHIAFQKNLLNEANMHAINEVLKRFDPPFINMDPNEIYRYMLKDKKNKNNTVFAALLKEVGTMETQVPIFKEEVMHCLTYYNSL